MHEFLTAREVADLLRIKERKLYDLTAERALPVTKVTGKLIFPRDALMAWLRANTDYGADFPALKVHPAIIAGSHDPLLDWAIRSSGCELATYYDGSTDGLSRVQAGQAMAAGIHFHGAEQGADANQARVMDAVPHEPVILVEIARRMQGLITRPDIASDIQNIADIAGRRIVARQAGAGSQTLFAALIKEAGIEASELTILPDVARSESDLAQAIAQGEAEIGFGVEAVARQAKLGFVPIRQERFDLLAWRRDFCEPALQTLMAFTRAPAFKERAAQLGGYDVSGRGTIRYNGP